jgi:Protein of unknown function (DUF1488)
MSLIFPNHSRSYDAARDAVRFWGYQSSMEFSFFVTTGALRKVQPNMKSDEAGFLGAFDANRDRICAIAAMVYARGRKGSYELVTSDF